MKSKITYRIGCGIFLFAAAISSGCLNVPEPLQDDVKKNFAETGANIEASATETISVMSKKVEETSAALAQQNAEEMRKNAQSAVDSFNATLTETSKNLQELTQQKILGNEKAAAEAFEKAKEFFEKGDREAARLYCLNAINHMPSNSTYFKALVEQFTDAAAASELEQDQNLLAIGLYQVDSKEVPAIQNLIAIVGEHIEALEKIAAQTPDESEELVMSIITGELSFDKACDDEKVARERLQVLSEIVVGEDREKWLESETERTGALVACNTAVSSIGAHLSRAEKLLSAKNAYEKLAAVSSLVQTANGILSQCWSLNLDLIPQEKRDALPKCAKRIVEIEKSFNEAKSQPALEKIETLAGEVQKLRVSDYEKPIESDKRFTNAIERLQKLSSDGGYALAEIYDLSMRKNSEEKIKGWQKEMADLMMRRYKAYQLWATEKCEKAWGGA